VVEEELKGRGCDLILKVTTNSKFRQKEVRNEGFE
jgi:hypothetical protein